MAPLRLEMITKAYETSYEKPPETAEVFALKETRRQSLPLRWRSC